MISSSTAKISEFFSICLHLVHESGRIIQSVYDSKDFEKQWKGKDDPVTQADIHVQTLLSTGLRFFYPQIKIVGEEDVEFKGNLNYDFSKINKALIPDALYQKGNNEFDLEESIVWIDPLDGTLSYVNHELDAVCTLIGVSYKKRPILGMVGEYYKRNADGTTFSYDPKVFFGHKDTKAVHYVYDHELMSPTSGFMGEGSMIPWELKPHENVDIEKNFRVVCTQHRIDEKMIARMNEINGKYVKMGGSGHKINQVIEGKSDCYFYDRPGTKKWDTCAGEAILLALGGILTGMKGDVYEYTGDNDDLPNKDGVLAMLNKEHHEKIIKITKEFKL